jgi:hypothetical protein
MPAILLLGKVLGTAPKLRTLISSNADLVAGPLFNGREAA